MRSKITVNQLLSITLISFSFLIGCKKKGANEKNHSNFSAPIKKGMGERLREDYLLYPDNVQTTYNSNNKKKNLIKFSFNTSDIKEILVRLNTAVNTTDQVAFKFGFDVSKRWHLIAYPMTPPYGGKDGGMLVESKNSKNEFTIFYNLEEAPSTGTRTDSKPARDAQTNFVNAFSINTIDNKYNKVPLFGFSFNADQINALVNSNASGNAPDKVIIYLGLESVPQANNQNRWHVIAYGSYKGDLLDVPSHLGSEPSIYDKADPCKPCVPQ